jgi:DNA mismatch endonuclease, patch repair protein
MIEGRCDTLRLTEYGRIVPKSPAVRSKAKLTHAAQGSSAFDRKLPAAHPLPSSSSSSAVMRANRKTDTRPEIRLRSELHRRGFRFRKHFVAGLGGRRKVTIDVAFPRHRVAVFVDGCFWHVCAIHGISPRVNSWYWTPKLQRNVERDRELDELLEAAGWHVVHVWEHCAVSGAADAVETALSETRPKPTA